MTDKTKEMWKKIKIIHKYVIQAKIIFELFVRK